MRTWLRLPYELGFSTGSPSSVSMSVRGEDHPDALIVANTAPVVVNMFQHFDDLRDLDGDEVSHALRQVRRLSAVTRALEEELIVVAREDCGASWRELGTMLDTHWSSARERYQRIKEANARGLTADAVAADQQ